MHHQLIPFRFFWYITSWPSSRMMILTWMVFFCLVIIPTDFYFLSLTMTWGELLRRFFFLDSRSSTFFFYFDCNLGHLSVMINYKQFSSASDPFAGRCGYSFYQAYLILRLFDPLQTYHYLLLFLWPFWDLALMISVYRFGCWSFWFKIPVLIDLLISPRQAGSSSGKVLIPSRFLLFWTSNMMK